MFLSNAALLGLAALALADPIPQAAVTTDVGSSPSEISGLASMSNALVSLSSLNSVFAGAPTLDPSAESVLLTAIPTGIYTGQECQTTTPAWYYSLPADVKSAISSYDIAFASWYAIHSTELNGMTATLPDNICAGTIFISGSGDSTTLATGTASAGHATATGGATATGSATKGATGTGTAASGTAKATGTATGSETAATGTSGSASSSSSKAAAPRATGAVGVTLAGVVGVFGLMVAL